MQKRRLPNDINLFMEKCKHHNLKITPQRVAIYKTLMHSGKHPSADITFKEVKKEFPNISFDTVNRTLVTFSKIGIIDVVEGHGDPRRFDPNTAPHHHFYCIRCGQLIDFYSEQLNNIKIPIKINQNFTVISKKVVLKGYCDNCKDAT